MADTCADMADREPSQVTLHHGPAVADYPPGASFGPIRLPDFELVWLLSGTASWHVPTLRSIKI